MKQIVVALLLLSCLSVAEAVPIHYTLTGDMTGSLGEANFNNAAFELSIDADTDNIWVWQNSDPGWPIYETFSGPGAATIYIEGIGPATITQPLLLFSRWGDPYSGYESVLVLNALDSYGAAPFVAEDPALSGYDLSGNISASWTDLYFFVGATGVPLATDAGDLSFTSHTFSFNASVIPVPAALWLSGSALMLLLGFRRRAN